MSTNEIIENATLMPDDLPPLDPAIVILAADHVVLSWNHRAESLTGYTLEALRGVDVMRLFEPREAMRRVRSKVDAGEFPVHERLSLRTADGRRLPVEVQYTPLRALDCHEAGLVLVIREVAPFQKGRRAPTRSPLLGRLAGDLSHEIRNPMNAIFLHMDIVEEEVRQPSPDTSAQVTQSLAIIKAEVTRLHALMQDYLFLARLSNLQPAPVDLRAFIEDLVQEMQPQCAVRGVRLVLSGLDDLGQVVFHQSIFRQALLNMLQLLTEVMPPETTLALSCERSNCHVQIQIRDPAKVIPPQVWGTLQSSLQAETLGAADLRRYVVQEVITAHGGELVVRDAAKAGMLCTIVLPLGRQA
jgi:PAS domain S-box-containing protein